MNGLTKKQLEIQEKEIDLRLKALEYEAYTNEYFGKEMVIIGGILMPKEELQEDLERRAKMW